MAKAHQARQLKLESTITTGTGSRSQLGYEAAYSAPEASLEAGDEWDKLWSRMNRLDARERMILVLRYGLEGETPLTLKEIGRRLGVTREWVRKIEIRAVRKLDHRNDPDGLLCAPPSNQRGKGGLKKVAAPPAGVRVASLTTPRSRANGRSLPRSTPQPGQVQLSGV